MKLALTYALLAMIATATNIGAQDLTVRLYSGTYAVLLSVAVGTGVGLIVKYVLDKRYIFRFRAKNVAHDSRTFVLYTLMGLATTVIQAEIDDASATQELSHRCRAISSFFGCLLCEGGHSSEQCRPRRA
jgi:hypothetical protein